MTNTSRLKLTAVAALTSVITLSMGKAYTKMKAKYYTECYAADKEARELIP